MDLWVVAAVAGAGCLARYLNKLSKNVDGSSPLSLEDSYVNSEDCLLASDEGLESEKVRLLRNCNESDVLSVSNFNDYGNEQGSNVVGKCGFLPSDLYAGKLGHNRRGNRTSHRTSHLFGHIIRPSNSLESCLMAQQVKLEESVFSPSMATRSFLVGDGNQMISRANDSGLAGSEEYRLNREANKVKDKRVLFGVPSLSKSGSSNDAKKMKLNAGNGRSKRLSPTNYVFSGKHIHTQHDASFVFSLGVSFGIITSILANKREMDKLRELLKETENLVEDLQEALEMKDSMRMKELHDENYGLQGTYDHSFCDKELNGFSPEKHMDYFPITDCKISYGQKEEESSESMSKIEAELEAELERLGLNMNESDPERQQSELGELDPDFVADFAQGELQRDMIGGKDFSHSELNEDDSDTMVPVNYAVSPHELTLRLHEVIQSRLEGRVQELEIALENSQRKLWFMESEHETHSQKCFPRKASSFGEGNVLACNNCEPMTEPLVMNLSDDPPGVYNDTYYEETIKIDDFEENSPSSIHITDLITFPTANEERLSRELSSGEVTMLEGLRCSNYGSNDVTTGDESCECDCEVERQLIRQIVERTKKGSPVFQNARRILYSMDKDDEH